MSPMPQAAPAPTIVDDTQLYRLSPQITSNFGLNPGKPQ